VKLTHWSDWSWPFTKTSWDILVIPSSISDLFRICSCLLWPLRLPWEENHSHILRHGRCFGGRSAGFNGCEQKVGQIVMYIIQCFCIFSFIFFAHNYVVFFCVLFLSPYFQAVEAHMFLIHLDQPDHLFQLFKWTNKNCIFFQLKQTNSSIKKQTTTKSLSEHSTQGRNWEVGHPSHVNINIKNRLIDTEPEPPMSRENLVAKQLKR